MRKKKKRKSEGFAKSPLATLEIRSRGFGTRLWREPVSTV